MIKMGKSIRHKWVKVKNNKVSCCCHKAILKFSKYRMTLDRVAEKKSHDLYHLSDTQLVV